MKENKIKYKKVKLTSRLSMNLALLLDNVIRKLVFDQRSVDYDF